MANNFIQIAASAVAYTIGPIFNLSTLTIVSPWSSR